MDPAQEAFQSCRTAAEPTSGFVVGHGLFQKQLTYFWEPDSEANAHMLVWGASGSGKSYLLRRIIQYLQGANKMVLVLDVHGDLSVEGENHLTLGGPNPEYGLNPFEFDAQHLSGPSGNLDNIIGVLRKSYMPTMGQVQELVLRTLITDVYRTAGIHPDRPETWQTERYPNIRDLRSLVDQIQLAIESGLGGFAKSLKKIGENISAWSEALRAIETDPAFQGDRAAQDAKRDALQAEINAAKGTLMQAFDVYIDQRFGADGDGETTRLDVGHAEIDLSPYMRKPAQRVLESLSMYAAALDDHGVFHDVGPPVVAGVNRFDLSGLSDQTRVFVVDTLLERVFRKLRARGEYARLPHRPRGERLDTVIVVDEAQLVIPRGKYADSPSQILNRMVTESRKFGCGLVLASQSPQVFPGPILSNVERKIGLRTHANDVPAAKRALGVKEERLFNQVKQRHVAMYSTRRGDFEPVKLAS